MQTFQTMDHPWSQGVRGSTVHNTSCKLIHVLAVLVQVSVINLGALVFCLPCSVATKCL